MTVEALRSSLAPFDGFDAAAGLGGLMLLPQNADQLVRLEMAAEIAASLSAEAGKPQMTAEQWRTFVNTSSLVGEFAYDEDPATGLFTKTVSYHGGAFVILPGLEIDPASAVTTLIKAIEGGPPFPDVTFARGARTVISAVLTLSDEVARRAGLVRGMPAVHETTKDALIPDAQRFEALKHAATFTRAEVVAMLGEHGMLRLGPLFCGFDRELPAADDLLTGELHTRPILLDHDRIIVALPGALASAAIHAVLRMAQQDGLLDELRRRMRAVIFQDAEAALRRLDASRISSDPWDVDGAVRCGLYQTDTDAAIVLYVAMDDLVDYDPTDSRGGQWHAAQEAITAMEERQVIQEPEVFAAHPHLNRLLHLFTLGSVGRVVIAGLGDALEPLHAPRLMLSGSDLETIAFLEHNDPLVLWKYAEAQERVREHTKVFGFAQLDEFALYRSYHHSYYLGDEGRPTLLTIAPSGGDDLRLEVHRKTDVHGAVLPGGDYITEVRLVESDIRIPIYAPSDRSDDTVRMLAEIDPPCWVVSDIATPAITEITILLVQAIAYWLWQFAESSSPLLRRALAADDMLTIRLILEGGAKWNDPPGDDVPSAPIAVTNDAGIEIRLEPSFTVAISGADNAGERQLLGVLFRAIRDRATALSGSPDPVTDVDIGGWIERHAPLGQKKKVLLMTEERNLQLIETDLPDPRFVQEADEAIVLDELGPALSARLGLPVGPIPDNRRLEVLAATVEWCFDELDALLRTLDPQVTLPWLIVHHERVLEQRARERLTIPTRLACYENMPDVVKVISRQREQILVSSLSARALIEYVAARPPTGIRPMSIAVYDRLVALVNEAIQRAIARDALQNHLSNEHLSILETGRLGMTRGGRYQGARSQFMEVHTRAELARAVEFFGSHWRATTDDPPGELIERLNAAAAAEFGFTLTELGTLLWECVGIGLEMEGEPKILSRAGLTQRLQTRLGWPIERVRTALELFLLEPRPDFWTAPPGFADADVYAWRFNRPLSYIRRPLVLRVTDHGEEIVWGFRHVYEAGSYLVDLCYSGRLKAKSPEMIAAITSARDAQAEAFNEAVAERYRKIPELTVRTQVDHVAGKRIERNAAEPLGDVDVLVIDPGARRVRLIEAKDIGIARTPVEMGQQLKAIFVSRGGKPASAEKHRERTEWVRAHLEELLHEHNIAVDDLSKWTVEPLLVTDDELMTPFLTQSPVPVTSWRELPVP